MAATNKTYIYKHFGANGYVGVLDNVVSEFNIDREINTAGSQLIVEIGISFQNTSPTASTELLIDDDDAFIVDDNGNNILITEEYSFTGMPTLNDRIEVWEFSTDYPTGKKMFNGLVSKWTTSYSTSKVVVTVLSYGVQLENLLVQIIPSSAVTQSNGQDTTTDLYGYPDKTIIGATDPYFQAQTFQVPTDTSINGIGVWLANAGTGSGSVQLSLYTATPTGVDSYVASTSRTVSPQSMAEVLFSFSTDVALTGLTNYYYRLDYGYGSSGGLPATLQLGVDSAAGYASGQHYKYDDTNGWVAVADDLTFAVYTATGGTGNSFNSYDPADIVREGIDTFNALGGVVSYTASSIEDTANVVSYTFKFNTYMDLMQKAVELAPANTYWFVDPADDTIYFKQRGSTVSHILTLGGNVLDLELEYSLEDLKNVVYFSGGDTGGGVNLLTSNSDSTSLTKYGPWLEAISDNRVTLEDTANILSQGVLSTKSLPRFAATVKVASSDYDTTLFQIGQLTSFANANNLLDRVILQIQAIKYTPSITTLRLGFLPPQQSRRIEDIRRNLVKVQTENNPDNA